MKSALRSKLWFPRPSMSMPIAFMTSIVGMSWKNAEIGGVAPTESPAAISMTFGFPSWVESADSASYLSNHALRNAAPPMAKLGPSVSDVSASGISWPW